MKAFLLLGSNEGDRFLNLTNAAKAILEKAGVILNRSCIYETEAWGKEDQPDFYNQALEIETQFDPFELLENLKKIERELGRKKNANWAPRVIDIDILLAENKIIETSELTIPHAQMQKRRFALAPLAEIAGEVVHPKFQVTVRELLEACDDPLKVKKVKDLKI